MENISLNFITELYRVFVFRHGLMPGATWTLFFLDGCLELTALNP